MTREEQMLNGFAEMMKGFWSNQDLEVPNLETPCKQEPCGDTISRQAAIDAVGKESQVDGAYGYMDTKSIVDLLNNLPAAQPEIIRCRDCKWSDWYDSTDGNRYCYCMETGASGRTADDFCSYAERRTDE